jgi:hypothetical protein
MTRKTGATRGFSHRDRQRMQESGKPEDVLLAPLEGAKLGATRGSTGWRRRRTRRFGATRRFPFDTAEGREIRGNSEISHSELPEDAEFGATRRCIGGDAGSAKIRGNPELQRRYRRRTRDARKLKAPSPAQPLRCRMRGNSNSRRKAEWDDA